MSVNSTLKLVFDKKVLEKIQAIVTLIAIIIGAGWSVFLWRYQTIILPSLDPTGVNLKTQFIKVGTDDSSYYFKLIVTIKNNSKVIEQLPSSIYNVVGYNFIKTNSDDYFKPNQNRNDLGYGADRFYRSDSSSQITLAFGKLLDDKENLNPDEEISVENIVLIPKGKFQLVDVFVDATLSRKNLDIRSSYQTDDVGKVNSYYTIIMDNLFTKNDTLILGNHNGYFNVIIHNFFSKNDTLISGNKKTDSLNFQKLTDFLSKYGYFYTSQANQFLIDTNYCVFHNTCKIKPANIRNKK